MISDSLKERIKSLPSILSVREVAGFFSVSYQTAYRQIRSGRLGAWKDDEGDWCVGRDDLRTFCSRNSSL